MKKQQTRKEIPVDLLRKLVRYDSETGLFFRIKNGAQTLNVVKATGYWCGNIAGKRILAHRAAWAITYGKWPEVIDHINRDGFDNRIANLRSCSSAENSTNMRSTGRGKSGYRGVGWLPAKGKFVARCANKYLGCFDDAESAAKRFDKEARRLKWPVTCLNFQNKRSAEL